MLQNELDVYGTKKIALPKPELYVIYTGSRKDRKEKISLKDDIFGGESIGADLEVRVIYDGSEGDIIYQYVTFCKVLDEQVKKYGRTETAVRETIQICSNRDILKEYLKSQEKEIVNIMMSLFNEETIMKNHDASIKQEGRAEGRAEGRTEGRAEGQQEATVDYIKNIMDSLGVTMDKAMESLKIPQDRRAMYAGLVEESLR